VLPSRLRHRVNTLRRATVRVGGPEPAVSPDTLMAIADACRRLEQLRFDYTSPRGGTTVRSVEPLAEAFRAQAARCLHAVRAT
jgi:predicted DNA-binding transcriptional regulator YafY